LENTGRAIEDTRLDYWSRTHVNFGAPFEILHFRQHFNNKWYIQEISAKLSIYSKCRGHPYQLLYFLLDY